MSSEAESYKLQGNAKLKASDPHGAIEMFTKAIELDPTQHVFYSNRSAAYLLVNDKEAALKDANTCISKNPTWAKGHARKGRALFAKNLFGLSAKAYHKAHELDPDNSTYETTAKEMEQEDRYQKGLDQRPTAAPASSASSGSSARPTSTPAPPPASASSSSSSSSTASSGSLKDLLVGTKDAQMKTALAGLRMFMFLNAIRYLVSFDPYSAYQAYRFAMFANVGTYLAQIVLTYGRPQFNMAYMQRIMVDWRSQYAMLSLLLVAQHPKLISLLPFAVMEIGNLAEFLIRVLGAVSPGVLGMLSAPVGKLYPRLLKMSEPEWANLSLSAKWQRHNDFALQAAASMEVAIMIAFVIDLVTPNRNILSIFAYGQFLRMRYMSSPQVKKAVSMLDQRVSPFLSQLPVVGPGYVAAKNYAASLVDEERLRAQAQAGGGRPSCAVM